MLVHLVMRNRLQYSMKFQIDFSYMIAECTVISKHIYVFICCIYAIYCVSSVCIYII